MPPASLSRPRKAGFLDLAAETRLQIYEQLLSNRAPNGDLHVVHVVDSLKRRQSGYAPYARYNNGNGQGLVPAKGSRHSAEYLHTAILQTCKKVADEGSHFLYSKNVFAINFSRESFAPRYRFFGENDCHLIAPIAELFGPKETPCYLSELSYVSFFKQIGSQNTATIQHLQMYANNTEEYGMVMPVLTETVNRHVLSLKTVVFCLIANPDDSRSFTRREYERYIRRTELSLDADEDYERRNTSEADFDPDNPARATGAFRPLYTALDDFSKKITTLECLEYRGHWHFMQQDFLSIGFDCRWAMMITDRIESHVAHRYQQRRREAGNLREKVIRAPETVNARLLRWRDYEEEEYARINRGFQLCGRAIADDLSESG